MISDSLKYTLISSYWLSKSGAIMIRKQKSNLSQPERVH